MARQISESTKIKFSAAFQRLWTASAASNLADGLLKTSAPLLATTLTKDPFWISTIAALSMLPWLFFAIPIGGLVDRINRRTMLAVANTLRLIAVLIIAVTTGLGLITLPILLGAIFIFGVGEVIYDTTLQSMMPEVLTKDQLDRGNARLQIVGITLAEFVGAPVSGLLFAASIALPFFFGAGGILLAVFLVLAIPRAYSIIEVPAKAKAPTGFWEDVRFGIRYLYEDKVLLKLVLLTSSIGFFFSASSSTMVLFLTETLQTPIALFGFLFAAPAVGALVGSMIVPKISERLGRTTAMAWSIFLSSVLVVIQGFSPNYWVLAALMVLSSLVITGWNILLMSTYHQIIPGELFGRIHGTRRTLVWGLMPIGALLGGVLASIDLRLPFIAGGIACSVLALWGFRFVVNLETAWTKKD
jgi:MFS family permease